MWSPLLLILVLVNVLEAADNDPGTWVSVTHLDGCCWHLGSEPVNGRILNQFFMFITALFTIAEIWNQPRCPSTEAWIDKINGGVSILFCHKMDLIGDLYV